ncbi:hypothetical protein FA13DRAFT_1724445 [Coprinellus micaceus]|uniref:Uncharacterized protein n=1 Tax=Coprinellus micaceus TaxID=71717 RepID=A0A4Y7U1B4_COPMI|nr:hypothetical protein FA13DRAFT_1724445 [Coprinellus micaceus]
MSRTLARRKARKSARSRTHSLARYTILRESSAKFPQEHALLLVFTSPGAGSASAARPASNAQVQLMFCIAHPPPPSKRRGLLND